MEGKTEVPPSSTPAEISFVLGGPFYRIQRALRLIHPDRWNVGRRIALLLVIGGLPLVVLTAVLNPDGLVSLLRDYRVHSRLLVAVPALVLGDLLMESRFRLVMAHIREAVLLDSRDLIYMNGVIAKVDSYPRFYFAGGLGSAASSSSHRNFVQRTGGQYSVAHGRHGG